ncbi:hypothetical protein G2W53_025669 [Senna tora]|uniref:Uncharacterized protein n=1 Tax=Senna tora TaxID=362788 RepID=A0A834TMN6_9FABA|nr:hypothetical protein G2W53_025669 [Senna tora]
MLLSGSDLKLVGTLKLNGEDALSYVPNGKSPTKRAFSTTNDGVAMNEHFIESDRQSGVVSVNHHGGGVSDETDIDSDHI